MSGLPKFAARFGTENHRIECPSGLRWPGGYVRKACGCREAQSLKAHVLIYRRHRCRYQEPVMPERFSVGHPLIRRAMITYDQLIDGGPARQRRPQPTEVASLA